MMEFEEIERIAVKTEVKLEPTGLEAADDDEKPERREEREKEKKEEDS